MKIDKLFKGKSKNHPINKRYSPDTLAAYERDLKQVIKLTSEGACMPTRKELREFFLTEYNMDVTEGSIHRHLNILKAGKKLWA